MGDNIKHCMCSRSFFMGFSILWIIVFHTNIDWNSKLLNFISMLGYGGVDIFLFCSGYGCYYSYNKDRDLFRFIKKRVLRLCPAWLMFMVMWIPMMLLFYDMPLRAALGNLLFIQPITGQGFAFNWYVSAIWLMYILAPYFIALIDNITLKQNILFIVVLVLVSIVFWENEDLVIIMARLPIFYIGLVTAKYDKYVIDKKSFSILMIALGIGMVCLVLSIVLFSNHLRTWALWWYPFIIITPGMCYLLSIISGFLTRYRMGTLIFKMINQLGGISFELFMSHIMVFRIVKSYLQLKTVYFENVVWIVAIIISIIFAVVFNKIYRKVYQKSLLHNQFKSF